MRLVIYDLDGTLVDSAADIAQAVNVLREELALAPLDLDRVAGYIGDGVGKLLDRSLADAPGTVRSDPELFARYRAIYRRNLLDRTRPYPGALPALTALRDAGVAQAVLTNKPVAESEAILEGLGLRGFFLEVCGGDSFSTRKPDPEGLGHLLRRGSAQPEEAIFVGDSAVDLETARRARVACALVTYGIGDTGALAPDYRLDDLRELTAIVDPVR